MEQAKNQVILVDAKDQELGYCDKLAAHVQGRRHRAISVFIFNGSGELLLQQRAQHKYHTPGLWTNTCCSHPMAGENTADAAKRRLAEEMGMVVPLTFLFTFEYRADLDNGLIEHEIDHVFIGKSEAHPLLNPDEAKAYKWASLAQIKKELSSTPELYTPWFKLIYQRVFEEKAIIS